MSQLTLGSLFDGIAGFPLAGRRVGMKTLWLSEIEPFPMRVSERRFPDAVQLGDIHGVDGGGVRPVDVVTFGSPCQNLSIAGKQAGLHGSQSSLFFEAVRVIKEMRYATNGKYPRWCVWENVPGALSSNGGRDFKAVLDCLVGIADEHADVPMPQGRWLKAGEIVGEGYSLAWRILDAAQGWGVAQRRKRIFLVLDLRSERAGSVLFESEGLSGFAPPGSEARQGNPETAETGLAAAGFCTEHSANSRGIGYAEEESPTLRAGVVPAVALNYNPTDARLRYAADPKIAQTLTARTGTGGNNVPLIGETVVYGISSDASHGMRSSNPHSGIYEANTSRTLDCNGGSPQCLQGGMAVVEAHQASVAMDAGLFTSGLDTAPTLLARAYKDPPVINETAYHVRRLTPLECLRLQGYPDDWMSGLESKNPTAEEVSRWSGYFSVWNTIHGIKPRTEKQVIKWLHHPNTDAAEYKAIGNSVAVPCVEFVLAGIVWAAGKE